MALNSLLCADVPLRNYTLTHTYQSCGLFHFLQRNGLYTGESMLAQEWTHTDGIATTIAECNAVTVV